ncbi:DUF1284 domain-containing protein [Rhodobacteraceae bacterium RKSG542]|uniref:DUF1284 domain-containing protein n=1 Tax=Pseudovibrio flavus TaxID=2529854 RepID=UPI0012BB5A04|nr:DUF1284 domain-containing protein [Pseudovibrio flavus]MTI18998.1 DUF1284 domain-containing protein [Pseudovibrio flavus]
MTVRLRGHHLLCMLTFQGDGYSPRFTVNYKRVIDRLNKGEEIEIVKGPDDVCAPLLKEELEPHCHNLSVLDRDARALEMVSEVLEEEIKVGSVLESTPTLVKKLRLAYASGPLKNACNGCQWTNTCDTVVLGNYKSTILFEENE